jgi:hypothetical protein
LHKAKAVGTGAGGKDRGQELEGIEFLAPGVDLLED